MLEYALPPDHETVDVDGSKYYEADNVYYTDAARGGGGGRRGDGRARPVAEVLAHRLEQLVPLELARHRQQPARRRQGRAELRADGLGGHGRERLGAAQR